MAKPHWLGMRALLAGVLVVTIVAAVVAAKAKDEGDDRNEGGGQKEDRARASSEPTPTPETGAPEPGPTAQVEPAGRAFEGKYAEFQWDQGLCQIQDYSLYEVPLFDSLSVPGDCRDLSDQGSTARVSTDEASLTLHDAPNGLIRFRAEGESPILLRMAPDATATLRDEGVDLAANGLKGRLFMTGEGQATQGNGTILIFGGRGNIVVHPATKVSGEQERVREAVTQGKVAAQVELAPGGEGPARVLRFDDVEVRVARTPDDAWRVLVDGNMTGGRVFVLNLGDPANDPERVRVRYFDFDATNQEVPASIVMADDVMDVFDLRPGEGPEYHVFQDAGGVHVLVTVPHFSVHAVELFTLGDAAPAVVIVHGVMAAVLFVALGTIGLFAGRSR